MILKMFANKKTERWKYSPPWVKTLWISLLLHLQLLVCWGTSLPALHVCRLKFLPIFQPKVRQIRLDSFCEGQFSNLATDFNWIQVWNLTGPLCFKPSIVTLALCLGWLSCWKVILRPSLKSFADSRIVLYLAPSIFPSTLTILPVSAEEKHLQSRMLQPCVTVGTVCSEWCAVLVAFRVRLWPKSTFLLMFAVSPDMASGKLQIGLLMFCCFFLKQWETVKSIVDEAHSQGRRVA